MKEGSDTEEARRTECPSLSKEGSDAEEAKRTNVRHLRSRDAGKARKTDVRHMKGSRDAEEAKRAECPSHEGVVTPGRLGGLMSVTEGVVTPGRLRGLMSVTEGE